MSKDTSSDMPRTATVELQFPIEDKDGRTIKSLTLRRMRAEDGLIGEGETNQMLAVWKLYAALAGVDLDVIKALDIDDLDAVEEAAIPLMGKRRAAMHRKAMAMQETIQAKLIDQMMVATPSAGAT